MSLSFSQNSVFSKAVSFVNQTNKHLFLTGKAGTGKTTFLKYIKEHSFKKMAVVAPTGVAAINAGGVTMHSLFQLPLGPYLPTIKHSWDLYDGKVNNQHSLIKNLRIGGTKRNLLKELDLLIIDEVSMVRADLLDMVDAVLRHVRRQPMVAFGGVQVLYIGDLFQLPPVVKNDEWEVLKEYYSSPFFFDAQVMQLEQPVFIELKKIYRQSDDTFIHILNNIRNNCCTTADLALLHQHYHPDFVPPPDENYIVLTSHNEKADTINRRELQKLPGKTYTYEAEISGEFSDRSFPAEATLLLKEGAQIMFLKNDKGEIRRFFNGKIGTIQRIFEDKIYISFPGETEELELEKETWQNIKYNYNTEKDKIEEEELGTFKQYPIRLAWAITIHKSQGLTFDKAIIDAGASFAPGQVYVALSRLTNLQGLVLHSRIHPSCISTDKRVLEFVKNEWPEDQLDQLLKQEQQLFIKHSLLKAFQWQKLQDEVQQQATDLLERDVPQKDLCLDWSKQTLATVNNMSEVSVKFIRQLEHLYVAAEGAYQQLYLRTKAAVDYFSKNIDELLISSLDEHVETIKKEKKVRKYLKALTDLKRSFLRQKQILHYALQLAEGLQQSSSDLLQRAQDIHQPVVVEVQEEEEAVKAVSKPAKGETQRISLQLYQQGKSIAEIARERNLTFGTIEGHLAGFITSGEVDVHELVSPAKLEKILELLKEETGLPSSALLKSRLSDDFSYGEIKAALKYWEKTEAGLKEEKE